jgi:hypothetical protein
MHTGGQPGNVDRQAEGGWRGAGNHCGAQPRRLGAELPRQRFGSLDLHRLRRRIAAALGGGAKVDRLGRHGEERHFLRRHDVGLAAAKLLPHITDGGYGRSIRLGRETNRRSQVTGTRQVIVVVLPALAVEVDGNGRIHPHSQLRRDDLVEAAVFHQQPTLSTSPLG